MNDETARHFADLLTLAWSQIKRPFSGNKKGYKKGYHDGFDRACEMIREEYSLEIKEGKK